MWQAGINYLHTEIQMSQIKLESDCPFWGTLLVWTELQFKYCEWPAVTIYVLVTDWSNNATKSTWMGSKPEIDTLESWTELKYTLPHIRQMETICHSAVQTLNATGTTEKCNTNDWAWAERGISCSIGNQLAISRSLLRVKLIVVVRGIF